MVDENQPLEQADQAGEPRETRRSWSDIAEGVGAGLAAGMGPDVYSDIKAGVKAAAGKLRRPPDAGEAGKGSEQDPPPPADPPK
jgi:hypothetical protein